MIGRLLWAVVCRALRVSSIDPAMLDAIDGAVREQAEAIGLVEPSPSAGTL